MLDPMLTRFIQDRRNIRKIKEITRSLQLDVRLCFLSLGSSLSLLFPRRLDAVLSRLLLLFFSVERFLISLSTVLISCSHLPLQIINAPRPGKNLLVLDLDYTLVDTRPLVDGSLPASECARPGLHEFLELV
jgi:hypothetical protein